MGKRIACIGLVLISLLFLLQGQVSARMVSATGMGMTAAEAENDALRNAVEQAVGVLVDSETLVRNNVLLRDEIYTKSRGFVLGYSVREKRETAGGWQVLVDADVDDNPNSQLMSELTRLGIIDARLRNPKIAVYIPEYHIQHRIPDPAGETAVIHELLHAGFAQVIAAKPEIATAKASNRVNRPYSQMTMEDIRSLARFLEADILVIGEAFSEGVGDMGNYLPGRQRTGMQSCRARMEAKAYIAKTGQIIAADGKYASGTDISESIASKKALSAAGQQMGEAIASELLAFGAGNRQGMEIVVRGRGFQEIQQVQEAISRIRGVGSVHLSGYEGGEGKFSVQYSGAPQTLFRELQALCPLSLSLESTAYNIMTIQVE